MSSRSPEKPVTVTSGPNAYLKETDAEALLPAGGVSSTTGRGYGPHETTQREGT